MIPGANLLNIALGVLGWQSVTYYRDIGRETTDTGRDVTKYCTLDTTGCSVQPLSGNRVAEKGLDTQKNYVTWYVQADVIGAGRDISGDMIEYEGIRYQCQSETDWFMQDGWKEIVCVKVGDAGGCCA